MASDGTSVIAAKNSRLRIAIRTPRSRTVAALPANIASSDSRWPNSLSSMAPPTLNRSVIALPMSALPFIRSRARVAIRALTHRDATSRIGKSRRGNRVTCQLSASMVIPTTITEMMFETVPDSVDVNALWAPITSLLSRLTSAPVWVRVKNASDWRCTWANTLVRRS